MILKTKSKISKIEFTKVYLSEGRHPGPHQTRTKCAVSAVVSPRRELNAH